jgi:hypothetical protein
VVAGVGYNVEIRRESMYVIFVLRVEFECLAVFPFKNSDPKAGKNDFLDDQTTEFYVALK